MNTLRKYFIGKYPLLPIGQGKKTPVVKGWQKHDVTTEEQLKEWEDKFKGINYGLLTGKKSGVVAVDVDGEYGRKKYREMIDHEGLSTWVATTPSGGRHYFFKYDKRMDTIPTTIAKGVGHNELRFQSSGQYIVISPSFVGSNYYKWVEGKSPMDIELSEMPEELLEMLEVKESMKDFGISVDSESGKIHMNYNIFARRFLKDHPMRMLEDESFFIKKDGSFKPITKNKLARMWRAMFERLLPDHWSVVYEEYIYKNLLTEVELAKLEGNKRYIQYYNGVLDLETFKLVDADSFENLINQIPHNYNPSATCPKFLEFLNDIFDGDQERIDLIFETIGYSMSDSTAAQACVLYVGDGSNGKSTVVRVMQHALGPENYSTLSLTDLNKKFSKAALINKKSNLSSESEFEKEFNTQNLKSITASDEIQIEKKFHDPVSYKPFVKLFFALNRLPFTRDNSNAFFRRLIIIPFDKKIEAKDQIKDIDEQFKEEVEGIIAESIKGLKRLISNNFQFTIGEAVKDVMDEYMLDNSVYQRFITEYMVYEVGAKAFHNELKDAYKMYCKVKDYTAKNMYIDASLTTELRRVFSYINWDVDKGRSGSRRYMKNVRINMKKLKKDLKTKNLLIKPDNSDIVDDFDLD